MKANVTAPHFCPVCGNNVPWITSWTPLTFREDTTERWKEMTKWKWQTTKRWLLALAPEFDQSTYIYITVVPLVLRKYRLWSWSQQGTVLKVAQLLPKTFPFLCITAKDRPTGDLWGRHQHRRYPVYLPTLYFWCAIKNMWQRYVGYAGYLTDIIRNINA